MVDWQALEGIGGVATAFAVVVALGFGVVQVRQANKHRVQAAITEIVANFLSPEFIAALDAVLQLPDDAPAETLRETPSLRRAFLTLDFTLEAVGVLVHEGNLDLQAVDRQMGGVVRLAWPKVRRYIEEERARHGSPSVGEWWQWLVERMEEDPAPGKREGAHVAFRDWRA